MPENYKKSNKPGAGTGTGRLRAAASGGAGTQKRTNAVEIIRLDPESRTSGYFYLNADGTLAVKGFRDLLNQNVRFSILEGAVILAHDDEEIPPEECIRFDEKAFSSKAVVRFLSENHALGTLFVKIFGIYSACPDIQILNYLSLQK